MSRQRHSWRGAVVPLTLIAATFTAVSCYPQIAQAQTQRIERFKPAPSGAITVQLDAIEMGQLVTVLLRDVMRVPYVISPDVLKDRRLTSVNLRISRKNTPVEVVRFLRAIGYRVSLVGGAVHVTAGDLSPSPATVEAFHREQSSASSAPSSAIPSGNPLGQATQSFALEDPLRNEVARSPQHSESVQLDPPAPPPPDAGEELIALLDPAYRSPAEIAAVLETVFPALRIAYRDGTEPRGGEILGTLAPENLTLAGGAVMVRRAVEVAKQLDKPRPLVRMQGLLLEVRETQDRGSALSVLADALGGFLSFGSLAAEPSADNFLGIEIGGIRAVLSAVNGDGRFRVVAEPSLAALSGSTATLNAGSQVPTLGSVSFSEDGTPIRSVVYRDSGLTLRVVPTVRSGLVELAVEQERSSFVVTTTGVNDSPTLNRSSASTLVTLQPGGMVAIAGLQERSEGDSRRGLFGGLLGAKTRQKSSSELLVLLEAHVEPVESSVSMAVTEFPVSVSDPPAVPLDDQGSHRMTVESTNG